MSKLQRPRLRELRETYLAVGECCEVGADPFARTLRMFEGLRRIIHSQVGIFVQGDPIVAHGVPGRVDAYLDFGWQDEDCRRLYQHYRATGKVYSDPGTRALARLWGHPATRRRREHLTDRQWYGSQQFDDYYRPGRLDDNITSRYDLRPGEACVITLFRERGDRPYSVRERRLVFLMHREIGRLIGTKLASFRTSSGCLPRRLAQVLAMLLQGRTERQIAAGLGLSPHTVHDHIKRLYRRFDVSSRAELAARCRDHVGPLAGGPPAGHSPEGPEA
jgi:DNA-binding CsgD family transcriptional regulator